MIGNWKNNLVLQIVLTPFSHIKRTYYYWSAWGWLGHKNITDFIVKGINEKKQSQQIIVVTHNPNIVVNTNSEQVIHMEFAGGEINASHSGALQELEIRDAICDVMEGGREALESRYYRITKALE